MPLILSVIKYWMYTGKPGKEKWLYLPLIQKILNNRSNFRSCIQIRENKKYKNLPVIIGITNNYESRPQSVLYTNTSKWNIGLLLLLKTWKY